MAGLPHMVMMWGPYLNPKANPTGCTLSQGCLAGPHMQTVSALPGGTSAPNTVITSSAVARYHLQTSVDGYLISLPSSLTATQINAARQVALANGVSVETKSGELGLSQISSGATALGIILALGVLVMTVGLIRSETARDLRTLTATGGRSVTRRTITAATAGAIGLLGSVLGMAGAVVAGLAWAHSSLTATFGHVPLSDVLLLLIGLPLIAAIGGWLLAGREPQLISRQPLE
jgi:putative ABC transport system permease protein